VRRAIEVQRLFSADAAGYREIRLEALRLAPEAFSSTLAGESGEPLSWFAARLESSVVFGAFVDGDLLGIAGFFVREGRKEVHKGVLWGMYVRPDARRTGIGRRLVERVLDHASGQVELIQVSVVGGNEPARRLYSSFGFVEYGIGKNALKEEGRYWDEVLMARPLAPKAGTRS
jgi:ribosomal protein S18 acetylase RimI-like enzyme